MTDARAPKQSEWPEFYNVAHPNDDHWVTMYVRGDIRDAQLAASQAKVEALERREREAAYLLASTPRNVIPPEALSLRIDAWLAVLAEGKP